MSNQGLQQINPLEVLDNKEYLITYSETAGKKSSVDSDSSCTASSKSAPVTPPGTPLTGTSVNSIVCRICQTNTPNESLISPCNCKGTLAHVHLSCLEKWLNQSSRSYCELCMYHYNSVQTLRYGFWEGILMWSRHPRNRAHVNSDILISILLTIVTGGLVAVCILGMQYFVMEGKKMVGYVITLYLVIRDQLVPWYTWWKNTFDVRLLLSPTVPECGETRI
ncbi:hypothetical protein FQA39_LY13206 [Lamprigera yunnana]|nr:hypothetical protein FQA39_LY13206 [Lamprigera yunnana]